MYLLQTFELMIVGVIAFCLMRVRPPELHHRAWLTSNTQRLSSDTTEPLLKMLVFLLVSAAASIAVGMKN